MKFWTFSNVVNQQGESERHLRLEGPIAEESWWGDEVTPAAFRAELEAARGPVYLHLSSPGGDVFAASRIYAMLMDYPDDVFVRIEGLAASAASVVAMAGSRVDMAPTAMLMIHDPMTCAFGNERDMDEAKRILAEVKESIINAYEIKTGLSRHKLAELMEGEGGEGTWMSAQKAKELGFCDVILGAEEDPAKKPEEDPKEDPEEDPEEHPEENPEDKPENRAPVAPKGLRNTMAIMRSMVPVTERACAASLMAKVAASRKHGLPVPQGRLAPQEENTQKKLVKVQHQKNIMEGKHMSTFKQIRATYFGNRLKGREHGQEVLDALTFTKGENPGGPLLPVEVSNSLITDIYGEDAFLSKITHTQIKGLRLPKVSGTDPEDAARMPGTEAGEIELADEIINFGRYPGREVIKVPGTIARGTDTDLDAYITGRLNAGHRAKMRKRIFAETPAGDFAHMSVYSTGEGGANLTVKTGADVLDAIQNAIADLPEGVRDTASVAMPYKDWMAVVKTLANGAVSLFGTPSREILGFDVVVCDYVKADKGYLVGDFRTIHANYDDPLRMETDRDISTDMNMTVIGYDYDVRFEDPNALRLAKVSA